MGVINYISLAINGNSNPWDYLGIGNVLDADDSGLKVLTGLAADWYLLCIVIGTVGIIVTIMYIGLRLMFTKDPRKREEVKETMKWKVILALALFGMSTLLGVIVTVATAFVQ